MAKKLTLEIIAEDRDAIAPLIQQCMQLTAQGIDTNTGSNASGGTFNFTIEDVVE